MARSCVTDPRWRELVALYRYDWIAAADVLFGKTPTWQQDEIIESTQQDGSWTSVTSGHGTGKSDMTSIIAILFIMFSPALALFWSLTKDSKSLMVFSNT